MGAKISKRGGSYNLKKREKKYRQNQLDGRTSSIVNLTLSQIYEDELKTPIQQETTKQGSSSNHIYENQQSISNNESVINTIQNLNNRGDSERDRYSDPDDERIYENILVESESDFEEQVEKREKKRRKTWSQSEVYDSDKYFGRHSSISEEDEKKPGSNGNWKEILNGGYWENNAQVEVKPDDRGEQVEFIEVPLKNQKDEDSKMEQMEVTNIYINEIQHNHQNTSTASIESVQNSYNDGEQIEVKSEDNRYEQVEVIVESVQQDDPARVGQVEVNTETSHQEVVQDYSKQIDLPGNENLPIENQQEENPNATKTKDEFNNEKLNTIMNQSESSDIGSTNKSTINQYQEVQQKEENINNAQVEEINDNNVITETHNHKILSNTVSSTSDVFYEVASEGLNEDSEYDDPFFDAEDFTQVEVIDEVIKKEDLIKNDELDKVNPIKVVNNLEESDSHEEKRQNHVTTTTKQNLIELGNSDNENQFHEELNIDISYTKPETDVFEVKQKEHLHLLTDINVEDSNNDRANIPLSFQSGQTNLAQVNKYEESVSELKNSENQSSVMLIDLSEDIKSLDLHASLDEESEKKHVSFEPIFNHANEEVSYVNLGTNTLSNNLTKEFQEQHMQQSQQNKDIDTRNDLEQHSESLSTATVEENQEIRSKQEDISVGINNGKLIKDNGPEYANLVPVEQIQEHSSFFESTQYVDNLKNIKEETNIFHATINSNSESDQEDRTKDNNLPDEKSIKDNSSEYANLVPAEQIQESSTPLENTQDTDTLKNTKEEIKTFDTTINSKSKSDPEDDRKNNLSDFIPVVATLENMAEDEMKLWEEQETEEETESIMQIKAVLKEIDEVKVQIDKIGSTTIDKDKDVQTEMYQILIRLMRDVNSIKNNDFNEKIMELQNNALSEVHNCLKILQAKNI